jgi:UDP:flavonoid glycosyltransferase YjiC (YdhE family)
MGSDPVKAHRALEFVFTLINLGGNVPPTLAVASELTRRGHGVRVVVPDAGPEAADARMRMRADAVGVTLVPRSVRWRDGFVPPQPRGIFAGRVGKFFGPLSDTYGGYVQSLAWADAVLGVLRERPADVVATDVLLPGGLIAAESAGCASAVLMHAIFIFRPLDGRPPPGLGLMPARRWPGHLRDALIGAAINRVHRRDALPLTNHARGQFGLPHLRRPFEEFDRANRFLVMSSAHFDFRPRRLPANVVYTGFAYDGFAADEPWKWPWPTHGDRPTVLVSMSTNDQGQFDVLQRLMTAVAGLPIQVLVALGPSLRGRRLQTPPNVAVRSWVPHECVMPKVSLVVTHGGHGTVMKTLTAGVPILCIPLTADQPDIAARLVARGVGVRISKHAGPAAMRAAIMSVLQDQTIGTRVKALSERLRAENGVNVAANELERLGMATRTGPTRSVHTN